MVFDQGVFSLGLALHRQPWARSHTCASDGDGTITPSELQTLMKGVLGNATPLEDQVECIIKSIDIDGSGTIEFHEFLAMMSDPKFNDLAKDEHRQAFEMFDTDGNGQISVAELKDAFRTLGESLANLPPAVHLVTNDSPRPKAGRRRVRRDPARGRSERRQPHRLR